MTTQATETRPDPYVHAVLHGELLPCAGGHAVLLIDDRAVDLARTLADRAVERSGHPWVARDAVDDELLAAFARSGRHAYTPGIVAHSAIKHHTHHPVLRREQVAAVEAIRASSNPEALAAKGVLAYTGGEWARSVSVAEAVVLDGRLMSSEYALDVDEHDDEWGSTGAEDSSRAVAGASVVQTLLQA